MSSRHCLITSGETASSGGLRSSSLAAANGSLGATCAGALGHAPLLCAVGSSPRRWTARGLRRRCRRALPHRVVMELDNPSHGDAK